MQPLTAQAALDAYFLEARSKLLDLAGIFDRIDRGGGLKNDPRHQRLIAALELLEASGPGRAAAVQELFSLAYDPTWSVPQPKETIR
jgi:hypothetical protein